MQHKSFGNMSCPIARSLERVGEWWSILILRDAFLGLTRFDQFQKSLDIAPNILARRLQALVEAGLLERRGYSARPPRDEYLLTARGRDFRPVLWAHARLGQQAFRPRRTGRRGRGQRDGRAGRARPDRSAQRTAACRAGVPVSARTRCRRAYPAPVRGCRFGRQERAMNTQVLDQSAPSVMRRDIVAPPRTGRIRLSRKQLGIVGGALLAGLGVAWYGTDWWTVGRFIDSTDDAYVGGDVTVIAPKVAGFIAEVAVTDNQEVHAGDLLVRLDDRDYRAALAKAVAGVAGQQATLANLDATRRLQEAVIAQAQAELAATAAEITARQIRRRSLSQPGARSVRLVAAFPAGGCRLPEGARRRSKIACGAGRRTASARCDRHAEAADAGCSGRRRGRPRSAQLNLGYTELRAPIDGTVGNRSARTGAYATVGAQLISLVPANGLWVDANFKENQLARMHAGLPRDDRGRRAARPGLPRPRRQPGARHRRAVQRAAAGERHRQLHQDRAARAGAHPARRRCARRSATCGRACRSRPRSTNARSDQAVSATTAAIASPGAPIPASCRCRRRSSPSPPCASASSSRCWTSRSSPPRCSDIGGGLSAGADETAWVQTSYLIAEIIVIPLSGWLSRVMSTRWLFCASAAGFTLTSLLCGWAWDIQSMIVFRALQGFLGGSMIPTVFTTAFVFFNGQQRVIAAATIGASPRWRRRSDRRSAAGSPTTIPGTGCSSSTWCRASSSPWWCRCWCTSTSPNLSLLHGADYLGMVADGGVPRLPGIHAGGRPALGLVRRRHDPRRRRGSPASPASPSSGAA